MKKRISQILALVLSVCMLAGCGDTAADTNTKSDADTNKASGSEADVAKEDEGDEESQYPDYLNLDSARPIVKDGEEVTLKVVVTRESNATSDVSENWQVKFFEEELGIKLDIEEVSPESVDERKNLMLASNDMPDLILGFNFSNDEIVKYGVEGGQLLPLSDYFSEELTPNILAALESNETAANAYVANDGKMYMLPFLDNTSVGYGDTIGTQRVFIDTTYMEAAGYTEAPTTLDDFVDMLRAIKALDPAEMGVDEIWPLVSVSGLEKPLFMNAFGWVSNGSAYTPCWDVETQEVVVPALTEKYAEYIKLFRTLYSEGLIHPDYYTIDETATRALFAGNECGVVGDWAPYISIPDRFDDFIAVPALSSEWSPEGIITQQNAYQPALVVVNSETEYPEVILRLFDYLYTTEGTVYSWYGPMAGTDDTLGVVQGFSLGEDNTIVINDVEAGDYTDLYDYEVNKSWLIMKWPIDRSTLNLDTLEMLGVENPTDPELDLTNPDEHYRYICYEAHKGHLEPTIPGIYAGEAELERYNDLQSVLKSYADTEMAKFVVGERPIEEVDQLYDELMELGGDEYLEICKGFYQNYTR